MKAFHMVVLALCTAPAAHAQISCPSPLWPRDALRYELQGTTTVEFTVDEAGHADRASVIRSSGWKVLDDASITALRQCQFPRRQASDPVGAPQRKLYVWRLEDPDPSQPRTYPAQLRAETCSTNRMRFTEGTRGNGVLLRFLVTPAGTPQGVKVERQGESDETLAAAVAYIASCTFVPSMQAGKPVPGQLYGRVSHHG